MGCQGSRNFLHCSHISLCNNSPAPLDQVSPRLRMDPEPPSSMAGGHVNQGMALCHPSSCQTLLHMLGQSWCDSTQDTEMRVGVNLWGHQIRHQTEIQL